MSWFRRLRGADLVVFASPLYFWTIPSKWKAFIERFWRTFKKREQDHYCGKAPETIEEYIAMQPGGMGALCVEKSLPVLRKIDF